MARGVELAGLHVPFKVIPFVVSPCGRWRLELRRCRLAEGSTKAVVALDHTIAALPPSAHDQIRFVPMGLGARTDGDFVSLADVIRREAFVGSGRIGSVLARWYSACGTCSS